MQDVSLAFSNRAARVFDDSGNEIGMLYLEDEVLRTRADHAWWRIRAPFREEPAIHQYYWTPEGAYEDAVISGEGLRNSIGYWKSGQVEVEGAFRAVEWLDDASSRRVCSWLEAQLRG